MRDRIHRGWLWAVWTRHLIQVQGALRAPALTLHHAGSPQAELQSLVRELVPLFLELLRTLVQAPESHAGALARCSAALAAAQHLVNLIRPPQVRGR